MRLALVALAATLQTGCVATYATVGQLDGLSPRHHVNANACDAAWLSSADGVEYLNVAARDSVKIRDAWLRGLEADMWRCEPNGRVLVRYRVDPDEATLAIESIEPFPDALPAATVPLVHARDASFALPRPGPALLVRDDAASTFSHGHGRDGVCCSVTPCFVRDGRVMRLATTYDDTNVPARIAQGVLLPFTLLTDIVLLPVYVPVFAVILMVNPIFI